MDKKTILRALTLALEEDLNEIGDLTSRTVMENEYVEFSIVSRESLVLCGIPIIVKLFSMHQDHINYTIHKQDGEEVKARETIISGNALAATLFSIERIALNFMQHLSGISSLTQQFVKKIQGTKTIIRDTRKTTPGMRLLERYAVSVGGGESYRNSLSDKILIKDNHIASCGGVTIAIERVQKKLPNEFIAIECDNIGQVEEAVMKTVDLILLDNMPIKEIKRAVTVVSGKVKLEASGGVTLGNIEEIATTDVDYISIGMLTHSASNKDIGLDIHTLGKFPAP